MPPEIQRIVDTFLHNPMRVEVSRPATTAVTVSQLLVTTGREPHEKRETLRHLIRTTAGLKNAIIFCNRKREVALLHRSLVRHGFQAAALHGDLDQPARMAALDQFRRGEAQLLIASDVAARGLDIPDVSHVFNFDVPHHPDDYVHRVGRTGRAGKSGVAISIVAPADQKAVVAIEKLTGQSIPWSSAPSQASQDQPTQATRRRGEPTRRHRDRPRQQAPAPRQQAPAPRQQTPAPVARADESRPRPAPERHRRPPEEPASHLPAFLLRPVRVKA
jgi:superfamily II DNA/RNA helicase